MNASAGFLVYLSWINLGVEPPHQGLGDGEATSEDGEAVADDTSPSTILLLSEKERLSDLGECGRAPPAYGMAPRYRLDRFSFSFPPP